MVPREVRMLLRQMLMLFGALSYISAANVTDVTTPVPPVTELTTGNVTNIPPNVTNIPPNVTNMPPNVTNIPPNGSGRSILTSNTTRVGALRTSEVTTSTSPHSNTAESSTSGPGTSSTRLVNTDTNVGHTTTNQSLRYQLPQQWAPFCQLSSEMYQSHFTPPTNVTIIKCHVTENMSGIWKMEDLRESLEPFKNNSNQSDIYGNPLKSAEVSSCRLCIGLDIMCSQNSRVSISWPMKIQNLMIVRIHNCIITDYLKDSGQEYVETIPDTLRVLEITDSAMLIPVERFVSLMKNIKKIGREFDCGQDSTLERLVSRNLSYDFIDSLDVVFESLSKLGAQFMKDVQRIGHKCNFIHMLYLEEGNSSSTSKFHVTLRTANSFFDALQTLNISYKGMTELGDGELFWFLDYPKLQMLDLSNNEISVLGEFQEPLDTDPSLRTRINLQHNNISTLTMKNMHMFEDLSNRVLIDIRNNPIRCECSQSFKHVLAFIQNSKSSLMHNGSFYSYLKHLTCSNPQKFVGARLETLSPTSLCPAVTIARYLIGPIVAISLTCLLLILVLILMLKYRQEVTIFLFVRLNVVIPCQRRVEADKSKRYDAFVSYSSNEEDWVEEFFENLESSADDKSTQSQTFKFCMHHRDFIAGKTIYDNVIQSVESSRHTIIILSKHYLNSEFCLYEFQEAFRQSIMEKKRHLVIIMCGDIPHDELPRDLKRCIKTFTYIRKDDFMFRSRLVYALSVKQEEKFVEQAKSKTEKPALKLDMRKDKDIQPSDRNSKPTTTKHECRISSASVKSDNVKSDSVMTIPLHEIIPSHIDKSQIDGNDTAAISESGECVISINKPDIDSNIIHIDKPDCEDSVKSDSTYALAAIPAEYFNEEKDKLDQDKGKETEDNASSNLDTNQIEEILKSYKLTPNDIHKDIEDNSVDSCKAKGRIETQKLERSPAKTVAESCCEVNVKLPANNNHIQSETVRNNVEYVRSMSEMSYDTGYGSDRGSNVDNHLSLESCQSPSINGDILTYQGCCLNHLGTM